MTRFARAFFAFVAAALLASGAGILAPAVASATPEAGQLSVASTRVSAASTGPLPANGPASHAASTASPAAGAASSDASSPSPTPARVPSETGFAWLGAAAPLSGVSVRVAGAALPPFSLDSASGADRADNGTHAVLILTGGLRWDQLDHDMAPQLSAISASGVTGNLVPISVRGATCPIDSWLALSAGRKVSQRSMAAAATCSEPAVIAGTRIPRFLRSVKALHQQSHTASFGMLGRALYGAGVDVQPIGPGAAYVLVNRDGFLPLNYLEAPRLGRDLGELVAASASTHSLTIVDADAESYASDEERIAAQLELEQWAQDQEAAGLDPEAEDAGHMPADVVDGTSIDPKRQTFAAINILRLERILEAIPPGTRVLVASIVGLDTTPYMQLAVAADIPAGGAGTPAPLAAAGTDTGGAAEANADGVGSGEPGLDSASATSGPTKGAGALPPSFAFSQSVRQDGIIQLADIDPTILSWFGIDTHTPTGTAIHYVNPQPEPCFAEGECYTNRVDSLIDKALHSGQIQTLRGTFVRYWNMAAALFFALSLVLLAQPVYRRTLGKAWARLAWSWLGLTIAAIPLASFVVNMLHWWRASSANLSLFGGSFLLAGVFAALALATRRISAVAPMLTLGTVTAVALTVDAALGSHVMADSPIGFNLLTGARFYGVGNEAYSLIAGGAILALAFAGVAIRDGLRPHAPASGAHQPSPAQSSPAPLARRILATAFVGGLGLVIGAIDALPRLGADFGGVLSFLPALAVLVLGIAQIRVTWRRLAVISAVTVGVAAVLAVLDWMRPPEAQTHLGRFVQSIADGELFDVIGRKLSTNLRLLTSTTYRWVVLAAVALVLLALLRALMRRPGPAVLTASKPAESADSATGEPAAPAASTRLPKASAPASGIFGKALHWLGPRAVSFHEALVSRWSALWGYLAPREGEESCLGTRNPALRLALITETVCFFLAFALNDSGIVLPGVAAILVVPGLVTLVLENQAGRAVDASAPA